MSWIKTENSESVMPESIIFSDNRVILNRNFKWIEATEDVPSHYEYETWDMSLEQYEVYKAFEAQLSEQADAIIELAEIISEV